MSILPRQTLRQRLERSLDQFPVVLLLGPRQCGKTTLAREISEARGAKYFDLEDPETPLRLESASLTLKALIW